MSGNTFCSACCRWSVELSGIPWNHSGTAGLELWKTPALNLWTSVYMKVLLKLHYYLPRQLSFIHLTLLNVDVYNSCNIPEPPESLLSSFEVVFFLRGLFLSTLSYDALLYCFFFLPRRKITFSFTQFNYFQCSGAQARGLARLLFLIQGHFLSWWHT